MSKDKKKNKTKNIKTTQKTSAVPAPTRKVLGFIINDSKKDSNK